MSTTTVRQNPSPGGRWWLVALLVLVIVAILAIAFFVTHPHLLASSPTATPTATATPKPGPTGTPAPGPTGTPAPNGATPTPTPVSGTPTTPTAGGVKTGEITHPQAQIQAIQQGANRGQPQYTFYLNPVKVVQHNLPAYGFSPPITLVSPSSATAPTPTPTTNSQGLPQVFVVVKYQSKNYTIYLDQPVQKGPKGVWVIITIRACAAGQTSC
jgi:hypothetical protein